MNGKPGIWFGALGGVVVAAILACGGPMGPAEPPLPSTPTEGYAWAVGADGTAATVQPFVFPPGTPLYAARADVDVRESVDAPAGKRLQFREVVTVRSASEPVIVQGVRGVWYEVEYRTERGWVFGADVTPLMGSWNPSMGAMGGGSDEWGWTVAFGPDLVPMFRTRDPQGKEFSVPLQITERFRGGRLNATMVGWGDMGHEVQISQCDVQERSDGPACTTAKVRWSELAKSAVQTTLVDAWRFEPQTLLEPICGAEEVELAVSPVPAEVVLEAVLPTYLRGPDTTLRCTRIGKVQGSELSGDLIQCGRAGGGKSAPITWDIAHYVAAGDQWTYLPCASLAGLDGDTHPALAERGKKVLVRDRLTVPAAIRGAVETPVLKVAHRIPPKDGIQLRSAGTDPTLGELWTAVDPDSSMATIGALVVKEPGGGLLLYGWSPPSLDIAWTSPGAPAGRSWVSHTIGCDGQLQWATNVELDVDWSTLVPVGTLPGGAVVGALNDVDHPANVRLRESHRSIGDVPADSAGGYPVSTSFEDLLSSMAWVYVQDPWGRVVRLTRDDLKIPAMCEPVIYVYADPPRQVRIEPAENLRFFRSWPETYDGWTATAQPDGSVWVDGRPYEDLFWEGRSGFFAEPKRGWVVDGADAGVLLAEVLPLWGLNDREVQAMVQAWAPRLADKGKVRLGLYTTEQVQEIAPLGIEPYPDTLVRVLMDARPAQPGEQVVPPDAPPEVVRSGLVVVEWGGIWR